MIIGTLFTFYILVYHLPLLDQLFFAHLSTLKIETYSDKYHDLHHT